MLKKEQCEEIEQGMFKIFRDTKPGAEEVAVAGVRIAAANVIVRVQVGKLKYRQARKETPKIAFFEE